MIFGFSTGALALGDFHRGLQGCRQAGLMAVELSALRRRELPALVEALPALDLTSFRHASIHAPSDLSPDNEREAINELLRVAHLGLPIVVHPDAIHDPDAWRQLESALLIENMDNRKPIGRNAAELAEWLGRFPEARVCIDLAHARQVDPSMTVAFELVNRFRSRIGQLHLSELDRDCQHRPLSLGAVDAFRSIAASLPGDVPVILESAFDTPPDASRIRREVALAEAALSTPARSQQPAPAA